MRIGIDLGGTKTSAIVLGQDGKTLAYERTLTPSGDYQGTLQVIADLIAQLEKHTNTADSIGIGTPGAISPSTGLMRNSNSTCLNGMPLQQDIEGILGRQIQIANDADCFALSEASDGAGEGASSVFGVILGTGVGGGLVIDGKLHAGVNAIAGEWGHNPLPWMTADEFPGPPCYCGKSGCIETFLSGPGMTKHHLGSAGETRTAEALIKQFDNNPAAKQSIDAYVDRLARALASVINIIDPEVIVLGGGLSNIERLYAQVPQRWGQYIFSDVVSTRLLKNQHGDDSGVRGAAWLM